MKIALIPCGETEWQTEGRLLGRVELPITPAGETQCLGWADVLRPAGLARILHGPDELATRSAQLIAGRLGIPAKEVDELAEVDFGLWAGLTEPELKARFGSVYHELREAPLNVHPPDGEQLAVAAERIDTVLRKRTRRQDGALGLVLRPVALALARFALADGDAAKIWEEAQKPQEPTLLDLPQRPARRAGG